MTSEAFLSLSPILLLFNLPSSTLPPFDGFLLLLYGDLEFFALPSLDLGLLPCAHLVEKANLKSVFLKGRDSRHCCCRNGRRFVGERNVFL